MGFDRRSPGAQSGWSRRTGFTLIELVLVIGVLMLLIALLLPTLSRSVEAGKLTRRVSLVQQNGTLIALYSTESRDLFPISSESVAEAYRNWWKPLVDAGIAESQAQVDPDGLSGPMGEILFFMSTCLVYDPARLRPSQTEPIDSAATTPVRQSQVQLPSSKGLLFQWAPPDGPPSQLDAWKGKSFCCTPSSGPAPVAMCDGSGAALTWRDFFIDFDGLQEGWVGYPVWSTWNGYLGRDR
jgi:type II secretory pathway pseudopilin PulG